MLWLLFAWFSSRPEAPAAPSRARRAGQRTHAVAAPWRCSAGGESTHVVYKRIREGTFAEVPPTVSEECRHLIGGLLTVNVPDRATLEQVMAHPWLSTGESGAAHVWPAVSELTT